MKAFKAKRRRDEGFTIIEATLAVVIMAIMVLGLTIVLLAFREQLDRSWAVRVMDQYGNDVLEDLTHDLRNAIDVSVRPGPAETDRIDVQYLDPLRHTEIKTSRFRADLRSVRIEKDGRPLDPTFPPRQLGRGESYAIERFKLQRYGTNIENEHERRDSFRRKPSFVDAAWEIRFTLTYTRQAIKPGDRNWSVTKDYFNRVYLRNKNLVVKKGVTG